MEEFKILKLQKTENPPKDFTGCTEYKNGVKIWYKNGIRHRTDGPAIEYPDGTKHWYIEGRLHRTDGPASEYSDGDKFWFLQGKECSETEWKKILG